MDGQRVGPATLGDLGLRAVEMLAARGGADRPAAVGSAGEPVNALLRGVGDLVDAVSGGRRGNGPRAVSRGVGVREVRAELDRAAIVLAGLGDVARRVSWTCSAADQQAAADVADGVLTVAVALRLLVELELRALPDA